MLQSHFETTSCYSYIVAKATARIMTLFLFLLYKQFIVVTMNYVYRLNTAVCKQFFKNPISFKTSL